MEIHDEFVSLGLFLSSGINFLSRLGLTPQTLYVHITNTSCHVTTMSLPYSYHIMTMPLLHHLPCHANTILNQWSGGFTFNHLWIWNPSVATMHRTSKPTIKIQHHRDSFIPHVVLNRKSSSIVDMHRHPMVQALSFSPVVSTMLMISTIGSSIQIYISTVGLSDDLNHRLISPLASQHSSGSFSSFRLILPSLSFLDYYIFSLRSMIHILLC